MFLLRFSIFYILALTAALPSQFELEIPAFLFVYSAQS